MAIRLQIYGMFGSRFSLGAVSTAIAQVLKDEFPEIMLNNYLTVDERWAELLGATPKRGRLGVTRFADRDLERLEGHDRNADVGVFIGPTSYAAPMLAGHRIRVAVVVCETTSISPRWVEGCNQCHLIVVPSTYCKQAFLTSGVSKPIMVVNHGLEYEYRPYNDVHRRSDVFEFFNTFGVFAPPQRKGCEELIRSFLNAFRGRTDTQLRLRTHLRGPVLDYSKKYRFDNLIILEPLDFVPIEQYARLLSSVHCVVYPSRGEGFGLVPFQAIACETPVIAPYASGMTEYLSSEYATLIDTTGTSRGPSWDNQPGYYYDIDENDLTDKLIHVRENWQQKKSQLALHAPAFRQKFTWDNVLRPFTEAIRNLAS